MVELQVDVEFDVTCNNCGAYLNCKTNSGKYGKNLSVSVEPCPKCLLKAEDHGYENGYDQCSKDKNNEHI